MSMLTPDEMREKWESLPPEKRVSEVPFFLRWEQMELWGSAMEEAGVERKKRAAMIRLILEYEEAKRGLWDHEQ